MFPAEISLLYYLSTLPAPPWACFVIASWCCCMSRAGMCPSHSSSAREQTSNSTLACSPARRVMKWPGSVDSPWEGVRHSPAGCPKAGWGPGDPHPFPCAAIGAELACSGAMGKDSARAAESSRQPRVPWGDGYEVRAGLDSGAGRAPEASRAGLNLADNGWVTQRHV